MSMWPMKAKTRMGWSEDAVAADFNNDEYIDLAVANAYQSNYALSDSTNDMLLGDGGHPYENPRNFHKSLQIL